MDELKIQKIRQDREACVRKANQLIQESRFTLTTQQQRIVLYLISKITPKDKDFDEYEFSIKDFCACAAIEYNSNYKELKENIKKIADKSVWVEISPGNHTLLRWIEKPYINENSGTIRIRLDKDMKPFLLQLKQNYTQYELIWTLRFKSKYSIRLYELIKSIHYHDDETYTRRFTVDELRERLGAEIYKAYPNFRQKVIIPAVKEVNEYSDKIIEWKPIKNGKSVAFIEFHISSKDDLRKSYTRQLIEQELDLNQLSLFDLLQQEDLEQSIAGTKRIISVLGGDS